MPEFHAVQCCQCDTFQVQQVKKVAKFSCRLCATKQSVKHVHAISSKASDVRSVVMELNAKRQAADEDVTSMETPLPLTANGRHVKEEPVKAINWQCYKEESKGLEKATCADTASDKAYTTEASENIPKIRKIRNNNVVSRHIHKGREYRKEVVIYDNGSEFVSITPRWTRQPDSPLLGPCKNKHAASKRLRQPLLPMQPHKAATAARDDSGSGGHEPQASATGEAPRGTVGLGWQHGPAAAERSSAQWSGSLGDTQQPKGSRSDVLPASHSDFCSSSAVKAAGGLSKALSAFVFAAAPAQSAQLPSGTNAERGPGVAMPPKPGLRSDRAAAEGNVWQAYLDDVDELQCDATPGKQQQQPHDHSPRQVTGGSAADLYEACFATSYD